MSRQRNMAQMKEQIKLQKKELNETETANLSDAEFKILAIGMLHELTGYLNSIKKTQAEMSVTLREIKKNLQGTNSGGDKAKNQINDLEYKEEKSIQSEQEEEKKIKKYEDKLRNLCDIFKCINICTIGMPEGEEEEQEIENLFGKVMKGNFSHLAKK